jgi:hypothetical protein
MGWFVKVAWLLPGLKRIQLNPKRGNEEEKGENKEM